MGGKKLPSRTLILGNISRTTALYEEFLHTAIKKLNMSSLIENFHPLEYVQSHQNYLD